MNRKRIHRNPSMNLESLEGRRMMSAGDLDPTFGVGGKLLSERIGFVPTDLAVQRDGKIVAVGKLNDDFAVARVNPDGTLDRRFGGTNPLHRGVAFADFGGDRGDEAMAVAIQADGKIVVGGHMDDVSFTTLADVGGFAVARFNTDGSLDKSFDGDGKLTIDMPGADPSWVGAITIQADGRILLAGTAGTRHRLAMANSPKNDFAIARLLPSGKLDPTFGTPSGLHPTIRSGKVTIGFGNDNDEGARVIAVAPDGKIVVGGIGGAGKAHFAVARLHANGTLDKSFGDGISGDGRFNSLYPDGAELRDLQVQPDGSVLLAGTYKGNVAVAKLTASGKLDTTFNRFGHVETDIGGNDAANHVNVNREGVLVGGVSSGQFLLARYRSNGTLDGTFGEGGIVTTGFGAAEKILTTSFTPDGKIFALGHNERGNVNVARYMSSLPRVSVASLDASAAEGGNNASLIFTRDQRLSFPTRVYYTLSGTATFRSDYTGPLVLQPAISPGGIGGIGAPVGGLLGEKVGVVEIPANETFVVVPINIVDDTVMEQRETVRASIRTNTLYALGDRTSQEVEIAASDQVRVNFQLTATPVAAGYEPDLGHTFGARSNGLRFGWDVDNTAFARDRGSAAPGFIYNTFNHMQKLGGGSTWEIAVPNGMYQVKLAAGDPAHVDSVFRMNLENTPALAGTPGGTARWFERTVNVLVSDGRLTLSNGAGAVNNKIAFIEIAPAAPGAVAGAVTDTRTVRLPKPLPPGGPIHDRIFSQLRI